MGRFSVSTGRKVNVAVVIGGIGSLARFGPSAIISEIQTKNKKMVIN